MQSIQIFKMTIPAAIYVPIFYLFWVTSLLVVKKVFYTKVHLFAQKTKIKIDDVFINALDLPLTLLIFVGGVFVIENLFSFNMDTELLRLVDIVFKATAIIAVIIFFDKLFRGLINTYSEKIHILKQSGGMIHLIARIIVIGLGLLILMDNFGISITPILASLGVGSLAVALALQPTLENFFGGLQLIIDKPIAVGHFIKLDSGEEGYVEKIGWRSTWVRMLPNNVVVIPNTVLVNTRILNYCYPEKEISVYIGVGVHYDSDLEKVEKVILEVAHEILQDVTGGVPDFEPRVRFHTFNDFSIDCKVILRAKEFVDGYLIKHEFVKKLHKRFNSEGIIIPYPIRTLDWNDSSNPVKMVKE